MNNILSFYVAGTNYVDQVNLERLKDNLLLNLKIEPDNPYDSNAIKILRENIPIGYVPKKKTSELHPYRICKIPLIVTLARFIPEAQSWKQILVTVQSEYNLPRFISEEQKIE